jgi:hypothetical protein
MKKVSMLLVTGMVILSACQKNDVYLDSDNTKGKAGDKNIRPTETIKQCSIVQIIYAVPGGNNDILQFTYNSSGDPVTITRSRGASTGYPNYVFKYDQKKRLTDFIGVYDGNVNAEFWHKYFYDNHDNIVSDSTYIFPHVANGYPENAFDRRLTSYTYDGNDRIIKESTSSEHNSPVEHTYTYDANSNKTGSTYDGYININRTNKIWMFLNKDYSVNNPFNADAYNTSGLPSSFNLPQENAFGFLGNDYTKAQIVYSCDAQTAN